MAKYKIMVECDEQTARGWAELMRGELEVVEDESWVDAAYEEAGREFDMAAIARRFDPAKDPVVRQYTVGGEDWYIPSAPTERQSDPLAYWHEQLSTVKAPTGAALDCLAAASAVQRRPAETDEQLRERILDRILPSPSRDLGQVIVEITDLALQRKIMADGLSLSAVTVDAPLPCSRCGAPATSMLSPTGLWDVFCSEKPHAAVREYTRGDAIALWNAKHAQAAAVPWLEAFDRPITAVEVHSVPELPPMPDTTPPTDCPECKGRGFFQFTHSSPPCTDCGGTGKVGGTPKVMTESRYADWTTRGVIMVAPGGAVAVDMAGRELVPYRRYATPDWIWVSDCGDIRYDQDGNRI